MLSVDPEDQYLEVEDSLKHAARWHAFAEDRVRRFAGNRFRNDWIPKDGPVYKPHEWEHTSNMVPNLVFRDPTVAVEGLLKGIDDEPEFAIGQVLPQWIHGVRFAERLTPLAYDAQFAFGVAALRLDPLPGYNGAPEPLPLWPVFERISWRRFFQDPRGGALNWRYRGHYWRADKQDLLNAVNEDGTPVFDTEAVQGMVEDADDKEFKGDEQGPEGWEAERKVVTGYEFYVRETGLIYTLGSLSSGKKVWLREPRQFVGFPDDPYVVFGLYIVPDQVYPLPPLAVTDEKVREINAHRHQAASDAATSKRLLLYDVSNAAAGEKLAGAPSGSALGLPGVGAGMFQTAEFGGASNNQLEYIDRMTMELNEASGLSDQKRGATTKATATEVAEIAEADNARMEFARSQFHACTQELLDKVARLMLRSEQVVMPISIEVPDPMTGQKVSVPSMYVGGSLAAQDTANRVRLRIEPYSMERVSAGSIQRKTQVLGAMTMQAIPMAAQMPFFPWQEFFNDQGEALNMKGIGDKYFGWVQALAMAQAQAAAQGGGLPSGKEEGKNEDGPAEKSALPDPQALAAGV